MKLISQLTFKNINSLYTVFMTTQLMFHNNLGLVTLLSQLIYLAFGISTGAIY
jgi:hypothetical protein